MKKIFRSLLDIYEARSLLFEILDPNPLGVEEVSIFEAGGRVLAEDISAGIDVPSFDRSLRDGYAVRYEDVSLAREDNPVKLRVIGYVEAGSSKIFYINGGEAVKIATGAPIPGGANAVVMEEYTREEGNFVYVYKSVKPSEWIQFTGSDIMYGDVVLSKGTYLSGREVGVLASLGISKVKVFRRPKIGIISTGDEIVEPGESISYGKIYDVNGFSLYTRLIEDGAEPFYMGIVGDEPERLASLIDESLKSFDVIFTSGSTSVGLRDNLFNVISRYDEAEMIFYGVKASPGKPTIAALINNKLLGGLPGFPVSCLMIYDNLFSDLIRRFAGLGSVERPSIMAKAGFIFRGKSGVKYHHPVYLKRVGDEIYFYPVHMVSGAIGTLASSDGYIVIPENVSYIDKGERYSVSLFSKDVKPTDILVITSHSVVLDNLIRDFRGLSNFTIKTIYSGSTGGIYAVIEGYNDICGTHILDEDAREYNVPFLEKFGVKDSVLFRGFSREIGFVVRKGNSKGIFSFKDLLRKDIKFMNRSQGSGTRVFIDINLKSVSEELGLSFSEVTRSIAGYNIEAKTHTAIVSNVEAGKVDVGVSIKPATINREVDFISLGWENYDFLVNKGSLEDSVGVKKFVEYLSSDRAIQTISSFEGIKLDDKYMTILFDS